MNNFPSQWDCSNVWNSSYLRATRVNKRRSTTSACSLRIAGGFTGGENVRNRRLGGPDAILEAIAMEKFGREKKKGEGRGRGKKTNCVSNRLQRCSYCIQCRLRDWRFLQGVKCQNQTTWSPRCRIGCYSNGETGAGVKKRKGKKKKNSVQYGAGKTEPIVLTFGSLLKLPTA